jgi:hypothetical protein
MNQFVKLLIIAANQLMEPKVILYDYGDKLYIPHVQHEQDSRSEAEQLWTEITGFDRNWIPLLRKVNFFEHKYLDLVYLIPVGEIFHLHDSISKWYTVTEIQDSNFDMYNMDILKYSTMVL